MAAATGIAALACAFAPAAEARTYTVWSCRGPDWQPVGTRGWHNSALNAAAGEVQFLDACDYGGPLAVALAPNATFSSAVTGRTTFATPDGTRIVGYRLWRTVAVAPPRLLGFYDFVAGVVETSGGASTVVSGCSTRDSCQSAGDPAHPDSTANLVSEQRAPLDGVGLEVACDQSQCGNPAGLTAAATLFRARIDLDDPAAPTAVLSGGLAAESAAAGRTSVVVSAADAGAGVASMTFAVDRRQLDAGTSCTPPYDEPQPCEATTARTFSVDASSLAEGTHLASGTVVDGAGNVTTWYLPFDVRRATSGGMGGESAQQTPDPARAPRLKLTHRVFTHAPGRAAVLHGSLRTRSGAPVAHARLTVASTDLGAAGRRTVRKRTVTTDRNGRFTVRLRRDGAQQVAITYSPRPGLVTASTSATVRTRLAMTLAASRAVLSKGEGLVLRGRLRGAGPSAAGAVVSIESIVNGKWAPVGVARAHAGGRWSWRYRFMHLRRDTIFAFRAVVRHAPGWPWPTKRTRHVDVRVNVG